MNKLWVNVSCGVTTIYSRLHWKRTETLVVESFNDYKDKTKNDRRNDWTEKRLHGQLIRKINDLTSL